ncbi:MAG: glycosyl hydrolase 53 family protein [Bryobacteraceae bacterium]
MRTCGVLLFCILAVSPGSLPAAEYAVGADLSFVKQAEGQGFVFKDNGVPKPALQMFKDHGYNWIRLRIFNNPVELPNNLQYTLNLAQAAKRLGYKLLLDFHYSDTWADPGKQNIPKAWQGMNHAQMVEALFNFTRDTITAFREAGVTPDMVQIGNEITNGMLWPDGKLPANWDNFADFEKAGVAGVEAGKGMQPRPQIMIHIDKGGDKVATKIFFDKLESYHVQFDVIGQSYYPWWHGSLDDLRENLIFMSETYKKNIVVVETAYNWKPTEYINNPAPFPESPQGQKDFLEELNRIVMSTPHGRGIGLFWWEPAVAPRAGGPIVSRGFFDQEGNSLPVLTVFDKFTRGKAVRNSTAPQ